jgi:hypothetical protein
LLQKSVLNILADSRHIAEDFDDPCVSFEHIFLAILESSRKKRIRFLTKKLKNKNLNRQEKRRLERQLWSLKKIKTKKFRHTFFRQRRKYLKKFYSSLKIFSKSYSSYALVDENVDEKIGKKVEPKLTDKLKLELITSGCEGIPLHLLTDFRCIRSEFNESLRKAFFDLPIEKNTSWYPRDGETALMRRSTFRFLRKRGFFKYERTEFPYIAKEYLHIDHPGDFLEWYTTYYHRLYHDLFSPTFFMNELMTIYFPASMASPPKYIEGKILYKIEGTYEAIIQETYKKNNGKWLPFGIGWLPFSIILDVLNYKLPKHFFNRIALLSLTENIRGELDKNPETLKKNTQNPDINKDYGVFQPWKKPQMERSVIDLSYKEAEKCSAVKSLNDSK